MFEFDEYELDDLIKLEEAYETIYNIMGDREDDMMFALKLAIDRKEEQLNPTVDEIRQTTTDTWMDPAGGVHNNNEEDPAKMYE